MKTDYSTYSDALTRTTSTYNASAKYTCAHTNSWWAGIGQYKIYEGGIPAADGSIQKEIELWVRLDNLHPNTMKLITSPGFYKSGEDSNKARIVANKELHSSILIES